MSIEDLKKKSIIDVAADLGIPFRKVGSHLYEREDHDSFKIFTDTNTFKWFSRDIQGDVINFVQLVKDVPLKEALYYLQHGDFKPIEIQKDKQEPFNYYLEAYERDNFREAGNYLKQERKLSDETIAFFRSQGVLAETIKKTNAYYEPVVVFKYLDRHGKLKGASLQGIRENYQLYENRGRLKQIMKHSDGAMGFSVTIGQPKRLIFLEAPIDLMSYYELQKDRLSDVRLVAMEGLKEATISRYTLEVVGSIMGKENFLETIEASKLKKTLETLANNTHFFQDHPNLITLSVDNDDAGRAFIKKLQDKGIPAIADLPPLLKNEKSDWNDYLKYQKHTQTFKSNVSLLDDVIMEAKKESQPSLHQEMRNIYDYTEKAANVVEKVSMNQEKFAFLLAHHDNTAIYNIYAIKEDFIEEMMSVTRLYNECRGDRNAMLDKAIDQGLITDKATFLKQYAKDFIKPELTTKQNFEMSL